MYYITNQKKTYTNKKNVKKYVLPGIKERNRSEDST